MAKTVSFVVSGTRSARGTRGGPSRLQPPVGTVRDAVEVSARRSGNAGDVAMKANVGEDVMVLHVAGGPALWLHPDTLADLIKAQRDPERDRGEVVVESDGAIRIPARLQWRQEEAAPSRGNARGFLGDVLVKAIEIVTGLGKDTAVNFAASLVVRKCDGRVNEGVYRLDAAVLPALKGRPMSSIAAADAPSLVLLHGTFSDTAGTFGKLWTEHPGQVRALFDAYGGRVYALDHRTLRVSPIANALTLAKALAPGTQLHLLTHSRGGLVAEVLARMASNPTDPCIPFSGKAHEKDREQLHELSKILAKKKITVDRVVRVACPARGTLLASKRLDAYVSVFKWALERAGLTVVPELVGLLGEIAKRRADPGELPGLAAQIPDSPLVQWLHGTDERIAGDLRVVAGDVQGDSVTSWVKTLLSDGFFWTDNDFVVQTRAMYGGTPREKGAQFVLDRGGRVSHFSYFSNPVSVQAIVDGLTKSAPAGYRVIGPLSWAGASPTGVRAGVTQRSDSAAAQVPALIVLPGILGSHLKVGKQRVWLGWRIVNGFDRLEYDTPGVSADGPIGMSYDDLMGYLSAEHHVIPFGFDWRRPIEDAAHQLADVVEAALDARKDSKHPVRMIAHSMGGIVARTMQIERPETWKRMMQADGGRLLMLGTPNGGSFAPMQVLSGDDTLGNLLTAVGAPFKGHETRNLIARFTGLLQLQAAVLGDLGSEATWQQLADKDLAAARAAQSWHQQLLQLNETKWGVPPQKVLDAAATLRRKLDHQRDKELSKWASKVLLVVGQAPATPAGYQMSERGLVYLDVQSDGDGRVTHEHASLPGVATWMASCSHGDLPTHRPAFDAYRDLLQKGTTTRLAAFAKRGAARGASENAAPTFLPSRPARALSALAPAQRESDVLSSLPAVEQDLPQSPESAIHVSVLNGDLTYVAEPLLIGHYQSSHLTGAEWVMDRAINWAMSASLRRGLYPMAAGTHQIFVNTHVDSSNPWQMPRPKAVIVAGLGAEGGLRGSDLVATVRQAVIAWGLRLMEDPTSPAEFTLATTLLGSGGAGIGTGQAAQLIVQGVREANLKLAAEYVDTRACPKVGHLKIIELYLDRAGEAWRALRAFETSTPDVCRLSPLIEPGIGALRRPPESGYRGADYDFISATFQAGTARSGGTIVYSVDTKRARTDVRALSPQLPLIRNLVARASNAAQSDEQIGQTLFNLLVPVDLEAFLSSSGATVLEVDADTAPIPWELLDNNGPGSADHRPWAIRTKLLRKLRKTVECERVNDASADAGVLVIGDPACDRDRYPALYGARREATAVADCFRGAFAAAVADRSSPSAWQRVTPLIAGDEERSGPEANEVVAATMGGPWRIIHIAGHGEPPDPKDPTVLRGLVLSKADLYLGPAEIGALRVVPELVFVNSCYLATGLDGALSAQYDRAAYASGVADALIAKGVKCVVAAGWAVDDGAAETFAATFYTRLIAGDAFIDAIAVAREAARAHGGNTWAAYQCYGDPDWRFRSRTNDGQGPKVPVSPAQELEGIASAPALRLALETHAVKTEFQFAKNEQQVDRLLFLEQSIPHLWKDCGELQECFGRAWATLGRFDEAITWYERALAASDGTAGLTAVEQLANLLVRRAWDQVSKQQRPATLAAARTAITRATTLLDTALAVGHTSERHCLCGSAFKRLAMVEGAARNRAAELRAIKQMQVHFGAGERLVLAQETGIAPVSRHLFYPAMNRIAADIVLAVVARRAPVLDSETLDLVRRSMAAAPPEFWTVVGQTELNMYAAIVAGRLAHELSALTAEFTKHQERVNAPKKWRSVHDNATFVLAKYQHTSVRAEAEAAKELVATLEEMAKAVASAEPDERRSTRLKTSVRRKGKVVAKSGVRRKAR